MDYQACVRSILALVDGEATYAAALADAAARGFDGRRYGEFLVDHRLVPFAAPALGHESVRRHFPADTLEDLDARAARSRHITETLLAGAADIREIFGRAAVPFLCLKGLAFGQRYYGDIHRRFQFDLDVLIHGADRPRAIAALAEHNFSPHGPPAGRGSVRQTVRRDELRLDVHWNLRRRARRALPETVLWESPAPVQLGGLAYDTLSDEYALTFHAIAMCGDLRRGACRARQFLDLFMLLRTVGGSIDWETYFERRRPQALLKPCLNVLALLLTVWGVAPAFPNLADAIARRRRLLDPREASEALAIVQRPRDNPENPVWYRRVYPYSRKADLARRISVDLPHTLRRALIPDRGVPWTGA